ncbi:Ig-like domain-containing protein, partial [Streptomyces goshikiensis]|uniref:Ig-like domain-containing protein n=1 Tax=Streptomyces goshikiensis TaxID=1942 RepID=UPI003673C1A7
MTATSPGAGTPTGTVTFNDGGTTLGTGTLVSGVATFTVSSLSVNPHTLTVAYGGDTNFDVSVSPNVSYVVAKAATSTVLTVVPVSSVFGQSVTLTATVTATSPGAGTPTGTVTFKDGGTTLGTGTLVSGVATFTTSALAVASHPLTAAYGGDTNFDVSASPNVSYVVAKAATSTVLTVVPVSSVFGQSVTLTATVTATSPGAGTPTGTVVFKDGVTTLGTVTLVSGVATFTTSALAVASHTLTAAYGGDTNFDVSVSSNVSYVVAKAATSTVLTVVPVSSVFGQSVTLTATVTATSPGAGTPTGTVTFKDGGTTLGTGTLVSGVATFTT